MSRTPAVNMVTAVKVVKYLYVFLLGLSAVLLVLAARYPYLTNFYFYIVLLQ